VLRAGSAFFRPGSQHGENLLRFCFSKKDARARTC
jgi:hypothetical protein